MNGVTAVIFTRGSPPGPGAARGGSLLAPEPRIEQVAEGVAHQVEGEHRQHDRQARERRDPRAALDVLPALAEDVAPAGRGRWDAKAEEREAGLRPNGRRDVERGHH